MAAYADTIAQAFVSKNRVPRSERLWQGHYLPHPSFIGGVCVNDPATPRALYSYGPHYPVCIENGAGYYVNETPYYVTGQDRDIAGWGPRNERRKQSPSPTTRGHRNAVEGALRIAGYGPSEALKAIETENTDGDPMTHTLRLWVRS